MDEPIHERDFIHFKEDMDEWVKEICLQVHRLMRVVPMVDECVGNNQHNYELIREFKEELEDVKQDIKSIKLILAIILEMKDGTKQTSDRDTFK